MAKKYVSRCRVMRNGKKQEHLKSWKRAEVAYREQVQIGDGTGTVEKTKMPGFSFDYAVPKTGAKLDWSDVVNETWIVELDGGKKHIYSGVDCLKCGEMGVDFEKETVMTLDFAADTETIE